jgi:regulator of RNase E activity RraA
MTSEVRPPASAEMRPGPGFRIAPAFERPPRDVVDGLAEFSAADISDFMNRLYAVSSEIRPITDPRLRLVGPAFTVKVFPGDNLMVHKCLDLAEPGDVVLIDASASHSNSVLGDTISIKARHRGIAGFVIDGLVRDVDGIRELGDFPVFARGVSPIGPLHRGPGEINYPIAIGGIVVHPGDIVVAEDGGIVIVPQDAARDILAALCEKRPVLERYLSDVRRGVFSNAWVDHILASQGLAPGGSPLK